VYAEPWCLALTVSSGAPDDVPITNLIAGGDMKQLIAVVCFMLAASPFAMAQDKKDTGAKAPTAAEKTEKKSAETKKEPTAAQKAQQERMKSCSKDASDKKMAGDQRKSFMSDCMKKK
jgi:ribosomal protein L12E/L44/L45/RPP1/RPP2